MRSPVNMRKFLTLWTWNPETMPDRLDRAAAVFQERAAAGGPAAAEWKAVAETMAAAAEDCRKRLSLTPARPAF